METSFLQSRSHSSKIKYELGDFLKLEIDQFVEHWKTECALFQKSTLGTVTKQNIALYLHNLKYMISFTPAHLTSAVQASLNQGWTELAEFFKEKFSEEQGHDEWAAQDLQQFKDTEEGFILPEIYALKTYNESCIQNNPILYLAYILLVEYSLIKIAPWWLLELEQKCNIDPTTLTVISRHYELDQKHVEDDISGIVKLIQLCPKYSLDSDLIGNHLVTTLRVSQSLLSGFFNRVALS